MSLLDAAPVPSRIIGVVRTALSLRRDGELTRERLENFVSPAAIRSDPILEGSVRECIRLGLLVEEADQQLTVSPAAAGSRSASGDAFASFLCEYVIAHLAGKGAEADGAFCRTLAWSLMQPGPDAPFGEKGAEQLWIRQDPDRQILGLNGIRFGSFTHWARFLGFAWWQSAGGSMALHPDPTACFERFLPRWMEGAAGRRLPLAEFLRRAEQTCPWLEGGTLARETRVGLAALPAREAGRVSDSTALALSRLEKKNKIRLLLLSDAAEPRTLAWGGPERTVSHIVWERPT